MEPESVIDEFKGSSTPTQPDWNTNNDQVLAREARPGVSERTSWRLAAPIQPQCGDRRQVFRRSRRRSARVADKSKSDDSAVGDYLVWEETLLEAEQRKLDVLVVTGDVKEDWWRRERGQMRGPRPELVEELRKRARTRLFMLRPESLLVHAQTALKIEVAKESVQDVERVYSLARDQ